MFCKQCGKEIENGARCCGNCGAKFDDSQNSKTNSENSRKIPTGSDSGSSQVKKEGKKKGCLITVIVILVIIAVLVSLGSKGTSSNPDGSASGSESSGVESNSFVDVAGVSEEQQTALIDTLKQCGIEEIDDIVHNEEADSGDIKCYILETEYSSKGVVLLYLNNGTVGGVTYNGEAVYKDGAVVTTPNDIINRPDLEVLNTSTESDGMFSYITGEIRNNSNKTYSYAQVTINLYNGETQIGSTLDNINNLEPGTVWKFRALVTDQSCTAYKIVEVTGF